MAATTTLLTVEAYSRISDPPEGRFELHHGELVLVPPPKPRHVKTQDRLLALLDSCEPRYYVSKEIAFRPLPDHEVWVADVAVTLRSRWQELNDDWLAGSPEIVIEVLSPSNSALEMNDREKTCFDGGCKQFWVVDPKRRSVRVTFPDGKGLTYEGEAEIPTEPLGSVPVRVADIFAE